MGPSQTPFNGYWLPLLGREAQPTANTLLRLRTSEQLPPFLLTLSQRTHGHTCLTASLDIQLTKVQRLSEEVAMAICSLRGYSSKDTATFCVCRVSQPGQLSIPTGTSVAVLILFRQMFGVLEICQIHKQQLSKPLLIYANILI